MEKKTVHTKVFVNGQMREIIRPVEGLDRNYDDEPYASIFEPLEEVADGADVSDKPYMELTIWKVRNASTQAWELGNEGSVAFFRDTYHADPEKWLPVRYWYECR